MMGRDDFLHETVKKFMNHVATTNQSADDIDGGEPKVPLHEEMSESQTGANEAAATDGAARDVAICVNDEDAVDTTQDIAIKGTVQKSHDCVEEEGKHDELDSEHVLKQSTEIIFTCPICLNDFDHAFSSQQFFELASSCKHKFCVECLRAYCHSKLIDGIVQIPCCHFKLSDKEEDFQPCNVIMQEEDIHRLIFAEGYGEESVLDEWCGKGNKDLVQEYLFCNKKVPGKDSCESKNSEPEKLWSRYEKLKFDHAHGKDVVRRCPKCDEAQLFDVDAMKEHQAMLQASTNDESIAAGNGAGARGNIPRSRPRRQLERLFFGFNDGQPRGVDTSPNSPGNRKNIISLEDTKEGSNSGETDVKTGKKPTILAQNDISSLECGDTTNSAVGASANANNKILPQSSPPSLPKSKNPIVTCQSCNTEFCYLHSNAHPGETCQDYQRKTLEQDRANIEFANNNLHVKPCPSCGISVSKEGGCNQIKCGNCGTHFCWLCSKKIDDGAFPEHFRWWNINGCPNMQLDESDKPYRCTMVAARSLSIIQLIVLGIPSFLLALLSVIVCPCVVAASGRSYRERFVNCVSFWGSFLSTMVLFPFTCLGMMLLSALYMFVAALLFVMKAPRSSSESSTAGASNRAEEPSGGTNTRNPATEEAAVTDFLRELENIFERMEEGRQAGS